MKLGSGLAAAIIVVAACSSADPGSSSTSSGGKGAEPGTSDPRSAATYGDVYEGGLYHLGPVDWDETKWHNACAPSTKYSAQARALEGNLLAGLSNAIPDVASYCDACIRVETARGKTALLRVVTYGDTSKNGIDVSREAFAVLDSGENPRAMTWQFAKCEGAGKILYEFQTGSNEYWTSLWVRNARVPIAEVEVKSAKHDWTALSRGTDGTLTDDGGFGKGPFSIRLTGIDGSTVVHELAWPSAGIGGARLEGADNFR
jgi:expansin (peptidoglycan-binding protein)